MREATAAGNGQECKLTWHPDVSIVVPTYDRPTELERLLFHIREQSHKNFECLVIDDGSSEETQSRYSEIWKHLDNRFLLHQKPKNDRKGGPGKARNTGIRLARGDFIAFCDDDDLWIRNDHIEIAVDVMTKYQADMFLANMQTSREGVVVVSDWFSSAPVLYRHPIREEDGIFEVSVPAIAKFLAHRNFHANMLVVEKDLINRSGLYYENIEFGEDYDIQLRLVDNANRILCRSAVVADLKVHIHSSISRDHDELDRALCTIFACLRAETAVSNPRLRRIARANRAWSTLLLANLMLQQGRTKEARELAVQSFALSPTREALRVLRRGFRSRTVQAPTG